MRNDLVNRNDNGILDSYTKVLVAYLKDHHYVS